MGLPATKRTVLSEGACAMNRRKWLWAGVLAVPVIAVSGLAYADSQKARGYTCR